MSKEPSEAASPYRETLFLPKTDFPMRGGLPQQEPARLAKWDADGHYQQLRADGKSRKANGLATDFMLHDGPPYANGHIHIGTAMNKILKDIVVRSRQMTGFDADYLPGWDCHGLPIEWKVEEDFRQKGRAKRDVPAAEFRTACRKYAEGWIDIQRAEFKRLGVVGNWDDPYLTMAYAAEAATVREFLTVAMSDQLKRGAKPVMWSPVEQTALAEAEIEYADRKAQTIWVKFPVAAASVDFTPYVDALNGVVQDRQGFESAVKRQNVLQSASVVIWTTTPWTIPANRAVSFNPDIAYGLFECTTLEQGLAFEPWIKPGDRLILADKLAEGVLKAAKAASWIRVEDVSADELHGMTLAHPLRSAGLGGYDYDVPMLAGAHVSDDTGTGFVHTAPGHGDDDYEVWMANKRQLIAGGIDTAIPDTLDAFGRYTKACPGFEGLEVIRIEGKKRGEDGPANAEVIRKLIEAGALLARGTTTVRDAHSWRSKAPVLRRATPQWFIAMDQMLDDGRTLRERCLNAIDATQFTPERGRERLRAMVAERPDWLISRQRAWGVPLTLFVNRDTGEILKDDAVNARIVKAVEAGGADAWFGADAASFLGEHDASKYEKINDILDVWFDSGTTHAFALQDRGLKWPADLYLEGSDQHRGWFQSSLLESCATRGRAPFDGILTHGFVQAEDGQKMSKSLGNTVSPQEVCDKFGADILRIWVASSDYGDDPNFGPQIIAANVETYRKLRNTLRYLLGALDGFIDAERVTHAEMPGLERWVLHRLAELDALVRKAYHAYDFKAAFHALINFCNVDLSAVYFDIRKDSLYCDAPSSIRRRACRTVMDEVFARLVTWFAPAMPFTAEEAWEHRHPDKGSVHLQQFPPTPEEWRDRDTALDWAAILKLRSAVLGALEVARREKKIGSSLEATATVYLSGPIPDQLALQRQAAHEQQYREGDSDHVGDLAISSLMADVCITSGLHLIFGQKLPKDAFQSDEGTIAIRIDRATGIKCARSWKYFDPTTADPEFPDITPRDAEAVRELRKLSREAT